MQKLQFIINNISTSFRLISLLTRRLQRLPFWRRRSLGRAGQVWKDIKIQNQDGMINLHDNGIMRDKEEIWVDLGRRRIELKRRVREQSTYLRLVIQNWNLQKYDECLFEQSMYGGFQYFKKISLQSHCYNPGQCSAVGVWKTNNPQHQNVLVVIVFVLSWLPLNLYNLITDLLKALQGWAEIKCWRLSFKVQAQGRRINNSIPQDWLLSKQRQCHGKEN